MEFSVDSAALCHTGQRFLPVDAVYIVSDNDVDDDGDNKIPSTNPPCNSAALMVNLNNPVM